MIALDALSNEALKAKLRKESIAPSERRERERKGRDTGQFDGTLRASSVGRGSPWPMSPFDGIFVKGRASRSARSTGGLE